MRTNLKITATTPKIIDDLMRRQSFYPKTADENPIVSSKSRWKDPHWQLDNNTVGATYAASRLTWDITFSDGSNLLDPAHADLLEEFRRFAWSLFVDPRNSRSLKPGNASLISTSIKVLSFWMVQNNYVSLGELNNRASFRFMEELADDLEDKFRDDTLTLDEIVDSHNADAGFVDAEQRSEDYEGNNDSDTDEGEAKGLTYTYVYPRLVIWKRLWDQREAMRSCGVAPIQEEPFDGKSVRQASLTLALRALRQIPPLPDEIAIPIMNAANDFVESGGADLIRISAAALSTRQGIFAGDSTSEQWNKENRRKATEALKVFSFSVPVGRVEPWRPSLDKEKSPSRVLRSLIDQMVTACSIVLQSETGMRISELVSIPAGVDPETGLPVCIRVSPSRSGMLDLFYVTGYLSKMRAVPEKTEWLLAARPHGSNITPTAVRAIEVLQHMLDPFRQMSQDERIRNSLFISLGTANALPISADGVFRTLSATILVQQKRFSSDVVDWENLSGDPALKRYKDSRGMCIVTHQWRKSYARFVFQTNRKMIPAISRQFKHLSIAMTEQAYIGTDISLIHDIAEENRNMTVDILLLRARGKAPKQKGRLAKLMDDYQEKLSKIIEGKSDRDARTAIEMWCTQRNLKLFFHGYGSCIPGLAPTEAECHKRAHTVHWANREPNYAVRQPSICTGCYLFLTGEETLGYWTERYVKNMTAWLSAKARGHEQQYRISKARADQSANYLQFWGKDLPEINLDSENHHG